MSTISGGDAKTSSVPDKEAVTFSDQVPAGSTEVLTLTVPEDATVENVALRIYAGAELSLKVRMFVDPVGNTANQPLVEPVGKGHVDGDDDYHEWDLSRSVSEGDEIVVEAENVNSDYAYDYRVNMEIDYASGLRRFLGGVF